MSGAPRWLLVAGVDEVGRGPLAGPVTSAAVMLDPQRRINGLRDSKQLRPKRRELLAQRICDRALAWSVAWADPHEIDSLNIFQASLIAMRRALQGLRLDPQRVEIDGRHTVLPDRWCCEVEAVVGGDASRRAISAASILAKVHRDHVMRELDGLYPQYGFARHKGYPTPAHLEALTRHGPAPVHRRSFQPVRVALKEHE
ncbi:MAG: ribonuclease HII [Gammaproteobacteria bacterium]|nr:ribonuclease HII [Gammaproteobacteria bacterium]NNF59823.1 ribonuclease HII [Gammaproteobacteria bacterium]NNM21303.1 ribonuclease HII [Gammaproteobacteria bacterium]